MAHGTVGFREQEATNETNQKWFRGRTDELEAELRHFINSRIQPLLFPVLGESEG